MKGIGEISPLYTPQAVAARGEVWVLRERILQSVLFLFSLFGLAELALAFSHLSLPGDAVLLGVYIVLYLFVLFILAVRQMPFAIRSRAAMFMLYLLAISELFESGQLGEVRMILIVFVALTSVLLGYRDSIAALVVSAGTVVGAGILGSRPDAVAAFPVLASLSQGTGWIVSAVTMLMFSTVVAGAISMIIDGMERNIRRQQALAQDLENERISLERRIQERTTAISRRLIQLRTASDLTRSMSSLTDPADMLQQNVELIRSRLDLYYVGVFLLEPSGKYAVLQAGTGEAGRKMLADGHRLPVGGSSMIGWSISNQKARIALDVGAEAVRFSNPNLPLTRSELALPIRSGEKALGAMTVQSSRSNAFDEDDIAVLQGIADGLGVAVENDRLFNETRQELEEMRSINREYLHRTWQETIEEYGDLRYHYDNQAVANPQDHQQQVHIPLVLRNEEIGQIWVETDHDQLTEDEARLIESITNQTAIAFENARLLRETEKRAIQEQKLNALTARFSTALSIDEILQAAAQDLGRLPSVAGVSVRLSPEEGGSAHLGAHEKEPSP